MEKKDGISLPLFLEETPVCTDVKKEKKPKQIDRKQDTKDSKEILQVQILPQKIVPTCPARDIMNLMDSPFLALSKNRKKPIVYESQDGTRKTIIRVLSRLRRVAEERRRMSDLWTDYAIRAAKLLKAN